MTAPGWYSAEGDPPGSQRYWDGSQWIGEPIYEPAYTSPVGPAGGYTTDYQPPERFPSGLKALAITVSIIKAIPLVLGVIGVLVLANAAREFDDNFGDELGLAEFFSAAAIVILVVVLIAGGLLLTQLLGAIKERPMLLFVPAVIMTVFDGLALLSGLSSRDADGGGTLLIGVTFAAQLCIAVWAMKAHRAAS